MRIERVSFSNYCQHVSRDDVLGSGTIGILGANGSGKSNYLKGILRGLTGVSINDGVNADDIAWGQEKGYIEIEFSARGQYGKIKRHLDSARCSMTFGEKPYKTAKEVDAAIYDILGVSQKVLQEMVFVQQGNMYSVLTGKPSDRAKAFQTLFGTADAEIIRDLFQTDLAATAIGNYAEQLGQLEGLKLETEGKLDKIAIQLGQLGYDLLPENVFNAFDAQIKQAGWNKHYRQQLEENAAALNRSAEQRSRVRDTINANMTYCIENKDVLESLKTEASDAQKLLSEHQTLLTKWQQRENTAQKLVSSRKQLQDLVAPAAEPPYTDEQIRQTQTQLSQYQGELRTSQQVVNLRTSDDPHCPTCFQPINAQHMTHHQERVTALLPEVKRFDVGLEQMRALCRSYATAKQTYMTSKSYLEASVRETEARLAELPEVQLPDKEVLLAAQELVSAYKQIEAEYARRQTETGVLQQSMIDIDSTLEGFRKARQDLESKIVEVTQESFDKAIEALRKHSQASSLASELTGSKNTLIDQLSRTLASIDALRKEDAMTVKKREWRDLLEQGRTVLHRDQLPNLVAQSYLTDLNQRLMQYLNEFNVPFMAYIKPDLSVECNFGNGRVVPAGRLSGGQLVMLGIAFHFAKHELFAGDVGVLVLDEPTVYLDQQRIPAVYSTLERVKSYSKTAGLQLIVVTHEPRLMPVFDRTIEL